MLQVGAYEAKTHLSKLLARVMKGERITITRHGVPIAVLQPPDSRRPGEVKAVIADLRRLRSKHRLGGVSLKALIEEGRR